MCMDVVILLNTAKVVAMPIGEILHFVLTLTAFDNTDQG